MLQDGYSMNMGDLAGSSGRRAGVPKNNFKNFADESVVKSCTGLSQLTWGLVLGACVILGFPPTPHGLAADRPKVPSIGRVQSCLNRVLNTLLGRDGGPAARLAEGGKATLKSGATGVDRAAVATVLQIQPEKIFPSRSGNRFHLWRYTDNSATAVIDRREDSFEFLGEMITGMDKGHERALANGKSAPEWRRLVSIIENGGQSGNVPIDRGRLAVSVECKYGTCYFVVTDRSKKMIDYDSFSRFDGKVILDPRYEARDYAYLLQHQLPEGLPSPSEASKKYGVLEDGYLHYALREAKQYFGSGNEFYQFIDLAREVGFSDPMELGRFLGVNGYHRGVEMILEQIERKVPLQGIKPVLLKLSRHHDVGSQGGGWMPRLSFENLPEMTIYRGTTLSETEVSRLFKMNWPDYYETRNPVRRSSGVSPFGDGKYFSIDRGAGQHFAISNANNAPNVRAEPWYSVLIEAKVPSSRLRKDHEMSRWDVGEFQYDPTQIKPEEIANFTLYLKDGKIVKVPGKLLRNGDYPQVRKLLSDVGVPDGSIRRLLDERGPTGK